eukprot:gene4197-7507_t
MIQQLPTLLHQLQSFLCCGTEDIKNDRNSLLNDKKERENHLELGTFQDLDEMSINVEFTEEDYKNQKELEEFSKKEMEKKLIENEKKNVKNEKIEPEISIIKVPSMDSMDDIQSTDSSDEAKKLQEDSPPPPLEDFQNRKEEKTESFVDSDVILTPNGDSDDEDDELFQSILETSKFEKL